MGLLLIVIGLASAGLVAGFVLENHLGSAPVESFALFGSSFRASTPALVLIAFIAGAVTLMILKAGMSIERERRRQRRSLRRRLDDLERENAELRAAPSEGTPKDAPSSDRLADSWVATSAGKR